MNDLLLLMILAFVLGGFELIHAIRQEDYFDLLVGMFGFAVGIVCLLIKLFPI